MLKMKKGLALVLAAATALTFAPVANLDAPEVVQAATGQIVDYDTANTVRIGVNEQKAIAFNDLTGLSGANLSPVTISVDDDQIATVALSTSKTEWSENDSEGKTEKTLTDNSTDKSAKSLDFSNYHYTAKTGDTPASLEETKDSKKASKADALTGDLYLHIIAGKKAGDAVVTVSYTNLTTGRKVEDKIEVTVEGATVFFNGLQDLSTNKVGDGQYKGGDLDGGVMKITGFTLQNAAAQPEDHTYKIDVKSSNESVATVAFAAGDSGSDLQKLEAGTITVTPQGAGESTITVNFVDNYDSKDHVLATGKFKVTISDRTDTLAVSYDGNRDSKAEDYKASTSLGETTETAAETLGLHNIAAKNYEGTPDTAQNPTKWTITQKNVLAGSTIYLDTVSNKTSKITASDSYKRAISFTSDSPYFSVDNDGTITINENNAQIGTASNKSGYIKVSVDLTDLGNDGKLAGLAVYVPVTVYNQEAESLTVSKDSGEVIGQTVGSTNVPNASSFTDLPVVYLSTKDKKSMHINIKSSSGLGYVQGVVTAVDTTDNDKLTSENTDVITYEDATQTITAGNKSGKAVITITSRNDTNHYGNAIVKFGVEVVTKSANNVINAPSTISLSASNRSQDINAKTSVANTPLTYDIVKSIGSDEPTKSSDISVSGSGKVEYLTSNSGTAVVRIQGEETADAVKPDAVYVTVKYNSTKEPSALSVDKKELNLKPGDTEKVDATASGASISFKSSNEDVATVAQDGTVTAKKAGVAIVTVTAAGDASHADGSEFVTVYVSQDGEQPTITPVAVTGLKVKNKKGAKVSVTWDAQDSSILYRVYKKVGNGSWKAKNVTDPKATLEVKKGAKVSVKVKAFRRDENGKAVWQAGNAAKAKAFKTDKK